MSFSLSVGVLGNTKIQVKNKQTNAKQPNKMGSKFLDSLRATWIVQLKK